MERQPEKLQEQTPSSTAKPQIWSYKLYSAHPYNTTNFNSGVQDETHLTLKFSTLQPIAIIVTWQITSSHFKRGEGSNKQNSK